MEPFSGTLKKLYQDLAKSSHPSPMAKVSSPRQDQSFSLSIPASSTLQRLADSEIQKEARRCLTLLGAQPTASQWEMILAPTASTCVIAGAGSGKSTTLILRLLVLHKLLTIPLDEMHVFSFTRASTREFQEKLVTQLVRWEEKIEHKTITDQRREEVQTLAKRTVSTFHSVIARLRRDVLPGGSLDLQFFDLLESAQSEKEVDLGSYNPFINQNLSDKQTEILNAAHSHAYEHSQRYRELLTMLIMEQERQRWLRAANSPNQDELLEQWKWEKTLRQEQEYHGFTGNGQRYAPPTSHPDQRGFRYIDPYRAAVANRLLSWGISFSPLVSFSIRCPHSRWFPRAVSRGLQGRNPALAAY